MAKKVGDPTDPDVAVEEEHPSRDAEVQVDLKETPKASPKAPEVTEEDRAAEEKRWKALENQTAAQRRIAEELRKQVQELNERLARQPAQPTGAQVLPEGTPKETVDKYDQLVADGKWQEAVRVLSREEYKVQRDTETAQERLRAAEERKLTALERSKQKVRDAYPMLHEETGDAEAVESQLYAQAVSELTKEDDQFVHDPYAPELAMHRMEALARTQGVKLSKTDMQPSTVRPTLGRAGQTSMPASRGSGGASIYTLTREQKEVADEVLSHIPEAERYKHYARFAKMAETTGGAEA